MINPHNVLIKHRASSFYIIAYILTLLLFVPTIIIPDNIFNFAQLGPAAAAFIVIAFTDGRSAIVPFLKSWLPKRFDLGWLMLAILIPAAAFFCTDVLMRLMNGTGFANFGSNLSPIPWNFMFYFAIIVGSIGEEIGWRQYLLPLLAKRHGWLKASLIVGLLWGLWHLGIFINNLSAYPFYVIFIIEAAIIMAWLFIHAGKNLLTPVLFHSAINFTANYIALSNDVKGFGLLVTVFAIPTMGVLVFSKKLRAKGRFETAEMGISNRSRL